MKGNLKMAFSCFTEILNAMVPGAPPIVKDKKVFKPLSDIQNNLQEGDIIEFNRGWFSHYALYMGNGEVMNINAESKNTENSLIICTKLEKVCKNSMVCISNHDDVAMEYFGLEPQSASAICSSAYRYNGKIVPYEFVFRNCEYYSTFWRFGKGFSTQTTDLLATPNGSVFDSFLPITPSALFRATTGNSVMEQHMKFDEPMYPWIGDYIEYLKK